MFSNPLKGRAMWRARSANSGKTFRSNCLDMNLTNCFNSHMLCWGHVLTKDSCRGHVPTKAHIQIFVWHGRITHQKSLSPHEGSITMHQRYLSFLRILVLLACMISDRLENFRGKQVTQRDACEFRTQCRNWDVSACPPAWICSPSETRMETKTSFA